MIGYSIRNVVIEHLFDCIAHESQPIVSGEHAVHVLEIMLKAIQSAREGIALDLETSWSTDVERNPEQ